MRRFGNPFGRDRFWSRRPCDRRIGWKHRRRKRRTYDWRRQRLGAASRRLRQHALFDADADQFGNVKALMPVWTFSTAVLRGHEGAPLVVGDVMYVHTPFPNIVYALDLDHDGRLSGNTSLSRIQTSFH